MNPKKAYALRADAVYTLRGLGFKVRELAAIFKTTPEPIRRLEARGKRAFTQSRQACRTLENISNP